MIQIWTRQVATTKHYHTYINSFNGHFLDKPGLASFHLVSILHWSLLSITSIHSEQATTHHIPLDTIPVRPVENHTGARETIIAGTYHNLIPYALRSRRRMCREGENMEVCPLTIRQGLWGSVVSSSRWVHSGRSPGRKWILCICEGRKSHLEHHFQYFWAMAGPLNVVGPGKTFPPLPLLTAWSLLRLPWTSSLSSSSNLHHWTSLDPINVIFTFHKSKSPQSGPLNHKADWFSGQ